MTTLFSKHISTHPLVQVVGNPGSKLFFFIFLHSIFKYYAKICLYKSLIAAGPPDVCNFGSFSHNFTREKNIGVNGFPAKRGNNNTLMTELNRVADPASGIWVHLFYINGEISVKVSRIKFFFSGWPVRAITLAST